MEKRFASVRLSQTEWIARAREFTLDNDFYFRCRCCKEIMHEKLTPKHVCNADDDD